jgi:methyltransferase (TIGR00027 family)
VGIPSPTFLEESRWTMWKTALYCVRRFSKTACGRFVCVHSGGTVHRPCYRISFRRLFRWSSPTSDRRLGLKLEPGVTAALGATWTEARGCKRPGAGLGQWPRAGPWRPKAPTRCSSDPFARELAGDAGFALLSSLRTGFSPTSATVPKPYFSIRTKFLDDALLAAVRASSFTQVVILAAGLDTRAFRLAWPESLVLFEVDRDDVFNHKETVLERLGAQPRCQRRLVRTDFSQPWIDGILSAGFDPSRPAAILAEGFLPYLDESVVTRLFEAIGSLACEGSWLGMDIINAEMLVSPATTPYLKKLAEIGCPWVFGVNDPEPFLAQRGWKGTIVQPGEPEANYGRWPHAAVPRPYPTVPRTYLVTASRTGVERGARSSA